MVLLETWDHSNIGISWGRLLKDDDAAHKIQLTKCKGWLNPKEHAQRDTDPMFLQFLQVDIVKVVPWFWKFHKPIASCGCEQNNECDTVNPWETNAWKQMHLFQLNSKSLPGSSLAYMNIINISGHRTSNQLCIGTGLLRSWTEMWIAHRPALFLAAEGASSLLPGQVIRPSDSFFGPK